MLKLFVESEALIFPSLKRYAAALTKFISILRNIVYEVSSVRDTLKSLLHNKTQAKFVDLLRPILEDLSADIEILIYILNEHMGVDSGFTVRVLPAAFYSSWDSICALFCGSSNSTSISSSMSSEINMLSSSQKLPSTRCHEIDISGDVEMRDHRYIEHNLRDRKTRNMSKRRNLYQEGKHTAEERAFISPGNGGEKPHNGDVESGGREKSNITEVRPHLFISIHTKHVYIHTNIHIHSNI
jgi:hypothetical protein